jgi:hypothetical protein
VTAGFGLTMELPVQQGIVNGAREIVLHSRSYNLQ